MHSPSRRPLVRLKIGWCRISDHGRRADAPGISWCRTMPAGRKGRSFLPATSSRSPAAKAALFAALAGAVRAAAAGGFRVVRLHGNLSRLAAALASLAGAVLAVAAIVGFVVHRYLRSVG